MSETPFHPLFQTLEKLSHCIQNHLSNFIGGTPSHSSPTNERPHFSITSSSKANSSNKDFTLRQQKGLVDEGISANPVTKVELGRATWTFLHTLAAQFPDNPTRQQKKDVKELMAILSRMYPCKECADHFKEVLRNIVKRLFPGNRILDPILVACLWVPTSCYYIQVEPYSEH
eukprot:XP_010647928.1 PREDICTED: FAD-linked sulfhydryl oxidase ERV1 isoform X2 [Vitis vinifera]